MRATDDWVFKDATELLYLANAVGSRAWHEFVPASLGHELQATARLNLWPAGRHR
jgi:hypothetical protein